jgi:hypothetical protein
VGAGMMSKQTWVPFFGLVMLICSQSDTPD